MDKDQVARLLSEWMKQPDADQHLLTGADEALGDLLSAVVSSEVGAQVVVSADDTEPPSASVLLVGDGAVLGLSITGEPEEPVIEIEMLPVKTTPIRVHLIDKLEAEPRPGQGKRRKRTWTFDFESKPARKITHFAVVTAHPGDEQKVAFALKLAGIAGWPTPR